MPNTRNTSNFYDFFCVVIGLGLRYFDRMCASRLLFPRCKKKHFGKIPREPKVSISPKKRLEVTSPAIVVLNAFLDSKRRSKWTALEMFLA